MPKTLRSKAAGYGRRMRLALLLSATLPLAGCQSLTPTGAIRVVDTSCTAFRPITYSSRDTEQTQSEARGHNAAWDALCKPPAGEAER